MLRLLPLAVFWILTAGNAYSEKITLVNGEWAPYLSQKLKHSGYLSRIVKEAFAEEGVEVQYVFFPWKRGYEYAKSGRYEGSLVWVRTKEREQLFYYTDTVAKLGMSIFHLKGTPFEWNDYLDLAKYKIGAVLGYAYHIEHLEKQGKLSIERVPEDKTNVKKLNAGRLDAFFEDTEVGYELVRNMGYAGNIIAHPKPLNIRDYAVIINKQAPNAAALVNKFNRGLKKIHADGRYKRYLEESRKGLYHSLN